MHDDSDPDDSSSARYVWTGLLTVALAAPLFLSAGIGAERSARPGNHDEDWARSDLDPREVARARALVAELEQAAEERFLEARMARVSSSRATLPELLDGGDFESERIRGQDYADAGRAWLRELAQLPERASSELTLAQIPREVRRQIVAELECLVPDRVRAGRSRVELGRRYMEFVDFVEGHRENMHFDDDGRLQFERTKCVDEFKQLVRTVQQLETEVEERCPPIDDDDYLDRRSPRVSP